MDPDSIGDVQLGSRLAACVAEAGSEAFKLERCSRRILNQIPDLLGAETSLASPLHDLLMRPGFALLFSSAPRSQLLGHRDALLADLSQMYSPAMVGRLAAVLNGCLGESGPSGRAVDNTSALSLALIPLLSLLGGALLMGAIAVLLVQSGRLRLSAPSEAPASSPSQAAHLWSACRAENSHAPGPPPQAGDLWWPVVGPPESLAEARLRCRPDAFLNRMGNVQLSSFRNRETAANFADQLSRELAQRYSFWVGEPSKR
ncbi:MAG: hypothetical protein VKM92_01940 [Cyanobacteriota bacterium]|nr:hypothetical protein [Cyanobacteriota bacterium]